jgi:tetratricopeptide (TPR) repeat protein
LNFREKISDSYHYLCKAIKLGEEIGDQQVIGYACAWLTWTCTELGLLDEAIKFGERAQEIAKLFPSDHYLYFKTLGGIAYTCSLSGDRKRGMDAGTELIDYGQRHSNIRSLSLGHYVQGYIHMRSGDLESAIKCCKKALQIAKDPFYSQISRFLLGVNLALNNQFQEAEEALKEVLLYSQDFGCETLGTPTSGVIGLVLIANGQMSDGLKRLKEALMTSYENHRKPLIATFEYSLGQVYLQIVTKTAPISFSIMAKNVGFLLKNVPSAGKKAEDHFKKAIEVAKEIGANTSLGAALLYLGLLYKARGRSDEAGECLTEAIEIFERCELETLVNRAKEALGALVP